MIDTILFDNWNTLVQAPALMRTGSSVSIFQSSLINAGLDFECDKFIELYRRIAREQIAESEKAGWTEIDYCQRLRRTLEGLGVDNKRSDALARRAWDEYLLEWTRQTMFFPETPSLLERLKGRYKLGVVTNFMDGPTARKVFSMLQYENLFDCLIVSAEEGYMKPSPILFKKALNDLESSASHSIMVGDTYEADVVGAHNVGMRGVLVDLVGAPVEHIENSDAVIRNIGDLPSIFEKL
jgi:putative hydrolase of the HAD superfamily